MAYIVCVLLVILMVVSPLLLVFGLPGTWVILVLAVIWDFVSTSSSFTATSFGVLGALALLGEGIEFFAAHYGTKKFGGSGKGSVGGMVGAIIGAILCAPLFFGLGALLGALGGAFAGCFAVETLRGVAAGPAAKAAWGTALGRFGGFIAKFGVAIAMLVYTIPRMWAGI